MLQRYGIPIDTISSSDDGMEWESSVPPEMFEDDSATITLSCPSQKLILSDEESEVSSPDTEQKEESCQTESSLTNSVILEKDEYESTIRDASRSFDLQNEVTKVRLRCTELFGDDGNPEMDPIKFEKVCEDAGARNIFQSIYKSICAERMSESRLFLNRIRTIVIIYVLVFGQSQKSNWFQV